MTQKHLLNSAAIMAILLTACNGQPKNKKASTEIKTDSTETVCPAPFTAGVEVLNPQGGHVQGIATSEEAVYVSQAPHLTKIDWNGKLLCSREVPNHTGDICWYNGELYTAVALSEKECGPMSDPTMGIGKIQVFDKDLNLVRECKIDRRTDGITIMDGVIYIGMGSKTQPSKEAHRVNIIGRFDARTLKEIAPRAEFDYGYETNYGFQDITNDGKEIYASFYSVEGAPQIAVFDKDLNILRTHFLNANQGFDIVPSKLTNGKLIFIKGKTTITSEPHGVTCAFDYWSPEDAQ